MLTSRRLTVYTHDRSRLTPRQRRRAVHKANRLDAKARAVALAAIAVLVAGGACSGGGSRPGEVVRVAAGPLPSRTRLASEVVPTTQPPAPPPPSSVVTRSAPSGRARVPSSRPRSAPSGDDFWRRLANCESRDGRSGYYTGYFQMSPSNAAHYGISGGSSYEDQRAAAQDLAAHSDPHHQWPVCWARAGG